MNRYLSSFVPQIMAGVMMLLCAGAPNGLASTSPSGASQKARVFLAGLCDPALGLLPEYRGAKVYWLFHDNADLLLLACIAERSPPVACQHWAAAMRMWDGKGFLDAAARQDQRYATYKLGLALLAASRLSPRVEVPGGLLDRLLSLQDDSGGWITDYDAAGKKLGLANVETTCLSILGIEACNGYEHPPAK